MTETTTPRRIAATLAMVVAPVLAVLGCSSEPGHSAMSRHPETSTSVHGTGPYEVGTQIEPGVWISDATRPYCSGSSASRRDFDLSEAASDPDELIAASLRVGDVQRIELHRGEFFSSFGCASWRLEDRSSPRTPDPATVAGGCAILVGPGDLVRQTITFGHRSASERDARTGTELQDRLFAMVAAHNKTLWDSAGQLVDYLDDPDAYNRGDGTSEQVTRAVDRIRSVCGLI